jgi:molybdopterin-guanine dinucleotide biosynthesis protein
MASTGKKKTTMAKLARESRLRERRAEKDARKRARRDAAAHHGGQVDFPPPGEDPAEHPEAGAADTAGSEQPTVAGSHGHGSSEDRSS